nr:hypothetical protein [uncultured Caproiciproducens sp.]
MPDYREMYCVLFQGVTREIEILQQAQCETEKIYVEMPDTISISQIMEGKVKEKNKDAEENSTGALKL